MAAFKELAKTARLEGLDGPPSKSAGEALAKFIIKDMYAKAVQGQSVDAVVLDAEKQLKEIYGK
jgi:multiple sugar transport system substrate-binding protein